MCRPPTGRSVGRQVPCELMTAAFGTSLRLKDGQCSRGDLIEFNRLTTFSPPVDYCDSVRRTIKTASQLYPLDLRPEYTINYRPRRPSSRGTSDGIQDASRGPLRCICTADLAAV